MRDAIKSVDRQEFPGFDMIKVLEFFLKATTCVTPYSLWTTRDSLALVFGLVARKI